MRIRNNSLTWREIMRHHLMPLGFQPSLRRNLQIVTYLHDVLAGIEVRRMVRGRNQPPFVAGGDLRWDEMQLDGDHSEPAEIRLPPSEQFKQVAVYQNVQ